MPKRLKFTMTQKMVNAVREGEGCENIDVYGAVNAAMDEVDVDTVSDGYHTFGELYDHRRALTAAFLRDLGRFAWKSKAHHPDDNPMFEGGYFIVGANLLDHGQISYHYKLTHWDDFRRIPEIPHAPKYDGHTPVDVVQRLLTWGRA